MPWGAGFGSPPSSSTGCGSPRRGASCVGAGPRGRRLCRPVLRPALRVLFVSPCRLLGVDGGKVRRPGGALGFIVLFCALCRCLRCALSCVVLLGVVRRVWRACPRVALCVARLSLLCRCLCESTCGAGARGVGILGGLACPLHPLLQFFPLRRSGGPGWSRPRAAGLPGCLGVVGWCLGVLSRLSTVLVDVAGRRVDAGWRCACAWWLSRGSSWRVRVDVWRVDDRERAAPGGLPGACYIPLSIGHLVIWSNCR